MAGGGRSCDGSEEVPCIAQVIEVKQEYAVLCWRDAPDQLIQACQDAIVLSQRHSEYIPMRSVLKTGDVVSVRVQLTHPHAEVRWTALPDSLCVIKHTVIYEGVSKIVMDTEDEGHMMSDRGLVRFHRKRCKYGNYDPFPSKPQSIGTPFARFLEGDENGSQEGDVSSYWPRVFSGDQMRFRAISLPDGSWRAVKVAHLFADDISDWKFPNSKGHTTTAVLVGIELPSFAKGLDGLVVTAVNNLFTRQNEHHSASESHSLQQPFASAVPNMVAEKSSSMGTD